MTTPLAMFSQRERQIIEEKAIEQALRESQMARVELEPLLPVGSSWPFPLTIEDQLFLRFCVPDLPISPA